MRILDRYVLRIFLINFFILLLIILILTLLIDLLLELPEYIGAGRRRAEDHGGSVVYWTIYSLFHFNIPVLLLSFSFFSGPLITAAIGFTYRTLSRGRELMAMLTGGGSMIRVAVPVIIAGTLLILLAIPLKEYVVPPLAHLLLRSKGQLDRDDVRVHGFKHAPDGEGKLFSAMEFDLGQRSLTNVTVLVRGDRGALTRRISAASGTWDESGGGWLLREVRVVNEPFARGDDGLVEPRIAHVGSSLIRSDLSPDVLLLRQQASVVRLFSLSTLQAILASPSAAIHHDEVRFYVHDRFSMPVVHVLVALFTIPVFMQREPRPELAPTVKCIALCGMGWIGAIVMQKLAVGPFNPVFAAWLPVIVYLPVAAVALQRVRS